MTKTMHRAGMTVALLVDGEPLNSEETLRVRQEYRAAGIHSVKQVQSADAIPRAFAGHAPDIVHVVSAAPWAVLEVEQFRSSVVWDARRLGTDRLSEMLSDDDVKPSVARAVALTRSLINAESSVRTLIEDTFRVAFSPVSIKDAVDTLACPVLVTVGSGLGNIVYATPMIRWVSENLGRRVDVLIHQHSSSSVMLFGDAPWINAAYPHAGFAEAKEYELNIVTASAGRFAVPVPVRKEINQVVSFDYNLQGRFIPEVDFYLLGLAEAFPEFSHPALDKPAPFLRDAKYRFPDNRVVGIANGIRGGTWSKRQWPYVKELADRLIEAGYTVRSFGSGEEYVEGCENWCDLSIRDTIAGIAGCSYFVGHDGGMCHIADGLGVPTLWLFGPTGAVKNGPVFAQSVMLRSNAECSPCNFNVDFYRCDAAVCMSDLTVKTVYGAFEGMVGAVRRDGYRKAFYPPVNREDRGKEIAVSHKFPKTFGAGGVGERHALLPRIPEIHFLAGVTSWFAGDRDAAQGTFETLAQQWPNSPYAVVGSLWSDVGRLQEWSALDLARLERVALEQAAVMGHSAGGVFKDAVEWAWKLEICMLSWARADDTLERVCERLGQRPDVTNPVRCLALEARVRLRLDRGDPRSARRLVRQHSKPFNDAVALNGMVSTVTDDQPIPAQLKQLLSERRVDAPAGCPLLATLRAELRRTDEPSGTAPTIVFLCPSDPRKAAFGTPEEGIGLVAMTLGRAGQKVCVGYLSSTHSVGHPQLREDVVWFPIHSARDTAEVRAALSATAPHMVLVDARLGALVPEDAWKGICVAWVDVGGDEVVWPAVRSQGVVPLYDTPPWRPVAPAPRRDTLPLGRLVRALVGRAGVGRATVRQDCIPSDVTVHVADTADLPLFASVAALLPCCQFDVFADGYPSGRCDSNINVAGNTVDSVEAARRKGGTFVQFGTADRSLRLPAVLAGQLGRPVIASAGTKPEIDLNSGCRVSLVESPLDPECWAEAIKKMCGHDFLPSH